MDTRERLIATRRATVLNHTIVATCEIETRKQCAQDKAVEIRTRRVNFNIDMSLGRFEVVLGHHTVLIKRRPRMTHMRIWEWMKSVDKSCMLHNHYHANCVCTQNPCRNKGDNSPLQVCKTVNVQETKMVCENIVTYETGNKSGHALQSSLSRI